MRQAIGPTETVGGPKALDQGQGLQAAAVNGPCSGQRAAGQAPKCAAEWLRAQEYLDRLCVVPGESAPESSESTVPRLEEPKSQLGTDVR